MEQAKIYTKRENARRPGVAAGVPAELVEITVHKVRGGRALRLEGDGSTGTRCRG
ncbi:hypothetical protein N8I74_16260 [Chitiniphilus purpureus]|uniref:Uncharacterized protein n=1 Tax=Chitiniphilus purpureus TaxID=2981137 RepID=A0ABY6DLD5_9NEIS|nr:hypothetical protein [Chitiniphilus sp. CD1]UXY14852.1 hypothetical protein N8I74_16260 [Chitiniphilus sp. CD1]